MNEIFEAIKEVAVAIDEAIKNEDLGYNDSANSSGEDQLKLDVKSDKIIEERFSKIASVKALISEEKEERFECNESGEYTVCYDPLDGSSLVDVNLSVGSIFGIYRNAPEGKTIEAAAYVVYGPRIELVIATKQSAPTLYRYIQGEFVTIKTLQLNEKGKLNAPGGTQQHWEPRHKAFVDSLFSQGYRLRYSGGMVPDLHQILLKGGGIFSYPGTTDKPNGKLRQLFEVIPFALIYSQAGGIAINAQGESLLTLVPKILHDTSECFLGSRYEINKLKSDYGI